jgi:cell division septation protein DedD
MRIWVRGWLVLAVLAAPALAREPIRPAELPPADYAGQQYVDSKGCMFVRAGTEGKVLWVPRVSREGVPVCGNPPSGKRVPVAEEVGVQPVPSAKETGTKAATADTGATSADSGSADTGSDQGGYFVAVGSFGVAANADRAEARLTALNYRVVKGRVQGASTALITVFAGPFADVGAAAAARDALRGDGFPDAIVIRP